MDIEEWVVLLLSMKAWFKSQWTMTKPITMARNHITTSFNPTSRNREVAIQQGDQTQTGLVGLWLRKHHSKTCTILLSVRIDRDSPHGCTIQWCSHCSSKIWKCKLKSSYQRGTRRADLSLNHISKSKRQQHRLSHKPVLLCYLSIPRRASLAGIQWLVSSMRTSTKALLWSRQKWITRLWKQVWWTWLWKTMSTHKKASQKLKTT